MTNKQNSQALQVEIKPNLSTDNSSFTVEYSEHVALATSPISTIVPLSVLDNSQFIEQWSGSFNPIVTDDDMWQVYANDNYLFAAAPISLINANNIENTTAQVYADIFDLINSQGYPHLIRTWNFFPEIHANNNQTNNYKLFCSGRAKAYQQDNTPSSPYPAATVIGCEQAGLVVYLIASKYAAIGIENSQQVSAFEYPSKYSLDPPLFSRAVLHSTEQQDILFISGTASITGHETQHIGDAGKQLQLCINNIENLLHTAKTEHGFTAESLASCDQIKIYLSDPTDLSIFQPILSEYVKKGAPIYYFRGDMCRSDLLVEVEALAIRNKS